MIEQLNPTKYLKAAYRRRPKDERRNSFKQWMWATAHYHTMVAQFQPNAADAAVAWCRRKGVKA